MKCESCGGITLRTDALRCRHCDLPFGDRLQNDSLLENRAPERVVEAELVSFGRSWGRNSRISFKIAATIWYLPLAIGLLGFVVNGFHPEGLRAWLMARNGPMLIFVVGEDPTKIFVLPVVLELLAPPMILAFNRFNSAWPLVLLAFLTVLWALLGAATLAIS